jgi:hypothetical protein
MPMTRRQFAATLAATALTPPALAQAVDYESVLLDIVAGHPSLFFPALEKVKARGNPDMASGLIQAMRFSRGSEAEIVKTLESITGATPGDDWFDWMLWQEANPQITPHPSFITFKRQLMLRIDPNFDDFLKRDAIEPDKMRIRLEEITWGGVLKDGIPSLDNPKLVAAADAIYMRDDDLVFGVAINGDARAYPLRIMGWHEMFNETIGGVPVALAYCTLCGSGILFETEVAGRRKPLIFGSSGFLYRSNKLMFDRETNSLWNQFTGKPVVGPLVDSGITLQQRPVVITTWAAWLRANPGTQILDINTGHRRDYGSGVVYADYFGSDELMFPTLVDQRQHKQKDYVFGIRQFGGAKAWPLKAFKGGRIINDGMPGRPLVLIGDASARAVRAYERAGLSFNVQNGALTSDDGRTWDQTEDALVSGDTQLPRVAGHIAYWFAWNGYLGAESEIYEG